MLGSMPRFTTLVQRPPASSPSRRGIHNCVGDQGNESVGLIRRSDVSTEEGAVAAIRRRDIAGLATLVDLHQLKARRTAWLILGDAAAAEDVVAEAFLRVWDRIGKYDGSRPFEPWFYRIVVNLAIDDRRRRARSRLETAASGDVPSDTTSSEIRVDIETELHALSPNERAVIVLRYYHDLEEPAIAALLGCPVGTVKSRLNRARSRLRLRLAATEPGWPAMTEEGA
jgi:RNA polymerase sigma factor (sigma-70 family)